MKADILLNIIYNADIEIGVIIIGKVIVGDDAKIGSDAVSAQAQIIGE